MTAGKSKILIAEDELIIALDIKKILAKKGYKTCPVVSSGEEAIKKAAEEKPALILMDIMLNGSINGIEASKIITRDQNIPIIFLTGASEYENYGKVMEAGLFGFITKPYDEGTLCSAVQTAFIKNKGTHTGN